MVTDLDHHLFRHTEAMVTDLDHGLFWHTGANVNNLEHDLFRYTGAMVPKNYPRLIATSKGNIISPDYELWLHNMVKVRYLGT